MVKITPNADEQNESSDFAALTAEQAKALGKLNPSISPWWVVGAQAVVGILVSLVAWVWSEQSSVAMSAAVGALAVVIPAALFARGVTSKFASANAGAAVMSFFLWELVKIFVTVAVLYAGYRFVDKLSWPVMLVSLVVTIKVYWLALGFKRKSPSR